MGNKRNRRSRRLGTPSPERSLTEVQVETSSQGNDTLVNVDSNVQGDLDNFELRSQLLEPSQLSNEKQAWTENFENLLYAKMPPHLKKFINQAYLENGTYDQIVKYLEREMEVNGLEADEPSVKNQMTVTKKEQNAGKATKKQNEKSKTQTPKTVPNNTQK